MMSVVKSIILLFKKKVKSRVRIVEKCWIIVLKSSFLIFFTHQENFSSAWVCGGMPSQLTNHLVTNHYRVARAVLIIYKYLMKIIFFAS